MKNSYFVVALYLLCVNYLCAVDYELTRQRALSVISEIVEIEIQEEAGRSFEDVLLIRLREIGGRNRIVMEIAQQLAKSSLDERWTYGLILRANTLTLYVEESIKIKPRVHVALSLVFSATGTLDRCVIYNSYLND